MAIFKKKEYQDRVKKVKQSMEKQGIDLVITSDPANMNYLTGYDGWSFYVPQVVIISQNNEEPFWIGREMDVNGAKYTSFLREDRLRGYPDDYVQTPLKHPMNFVADIIKKEGWIKKVIGIDMDTYYFSPRAFYVLKKELPNSEFVDTSLLVNWVRLIKSENEILLMKQAGKIAEKVMQTALDKIHPGVRECDAVASVCQAQVSGLTEFGGDYPAIVPMMPTGDKTSAPHLTWTDEPYKKDQAVNLELAGCRNRYHCPIARTAFIGKKPPTKLENIAKVTVEGLNLTLDAIKPGLLCEDVEIIWRQFLAKHGLEKKSRIGYSMGLNYPPDWGEHTASLRPNDKTILRPGMTFHMILGMWMESYGFECSESFYVTENGAETFAKFERKLFIRD
jgi:ectoine hydrolase